MTREKGISFNEYFKEDLFTADKGTTQTQEAIAAPEALDHSPILEELPPADDVEFRQYRKALRRYFTDGTKTSESLKVNVAPVLIASYLKGEHPDTDFPVLYEHENQIVTPLRRILQDQFSITFKEGEGKILGQNLPRIELLIREATAAKDQYADFGIVVTEALLALRQLDVHGEEGAAFRAQCNQFEIELQKRKGTLLGFSNLTAFRILNFQLIKRRKNNTSFLHTLQKLISGLRELLLLQKEKGENDVDQVQTKNQFDFANQMISFDKLTKMMPPSASLGLPEARLNRVREGLHTLEEALQYFTEVRSFIFVSEALAGEFSLKETLIESTLDITSERSCAKAEAYFRNEKKDLVQIIAALRMAELEINNKYDEDLHTSYFEAFSFFNLSDEDIQLLPALIVVAECRQLMQEPEDFLSLLTGNVPVKVLAVNRLGEMELPNHTINEPVFRQELAALSLSHRNSYISQGAADIPVELYNAIGEGLGAPSPALWNLLFPATKSNDKNSGFVAVHTAIESRYFPRLVYNIRAGERFGSRFDISGNPQPEQHFPSYGMEIKTPSGKQNMKFTLCVADYFAMDTVNNTSLEIIPPKYRNGDLIPLTEYLSEQQENLIGKIPFIWTLDENTTLQMAAIPFSWLSPCKERLDYWQFIQELGGVNNYHVQRAIERSRLEWEEEKETEIGHLKAEMDAEIERIRQEEAGQAMDRLVNVLLDLDNAIPATPVKKPSLKSTSEVTVEAKAQVAAENVEVEEKEISSEVWVETFRCTSCNDCIDQLPAVFKYNSDKQTVVHNPKAGTYAKIITIAEKCPAKCIHPGLPQNPNEPGVAELTKRAEELN